MKSAKLKFIFLGLILACFTSLSLAQDSNLYFRGYIKEMNILNFIGRDSLISDNFIHNRLNLHYQINDKFAVHTEMRNRIFYGETVRLNPFYKDAIDVDPGYLDLSFIWMEHNAAFGHSIFDRAWFSYVDGPFEVKLGRQRVNWGINTVWNPNDIFNAFNFVDFDYEERPGNDAIRTQYYFKSGSKIELAYAPGRKDDEHIGAVMYKFNTHSYDVQIFSGIFRSDYVAGIGFAGNLGTAGLKGEGSYFINRDKLLDTTDVFTFTTSVDYSFRNGFYIMGSVLYNSNGLMDLNNLPSTANLSGGDFSAKNLMITRYSGFAQVTYPVTPLFSPSFAAIYGYGANILFLMPGLQYSIASNWDLNLIGQLYFIENPKGFSNVFNGIFLRTKWSF